MKSIVSVILIILVLYSGTWLIGFVETQTRAAEQKLVSKVLTGVELPIERIAARPNGWFVYQFSDDRSIIMSKNSVQMFSKDVVLGCDNSTYGIGTFEQVYGSVLDNYQSNDDWPEAQSPGFVTEGKPDIRFEFTGDSVQLNSEEAFHTYDYTTHTYNYYKQRVALPELHQSKTFYVLFGSPVNQELSGSGVGFVADPNQNRAFDFGKQVYRVNVERLAQDKNQCRLQVVYFDQQDAVTDSLWQAEAFAIDKSSISKVISQRHTLPNKNVTFYPQPYLEDEQLFHELVEHQLVKGELDGKTPRLRVSPAEKRLCELFRETCKPRPEWEGVLPGDKAKALLRTLHYRVNGSAVRQQIQQYNRRTHITGVYIPYSKNLLDKQKHRATTQMTLRACNTLSHCYEVPLVTDHIPSLMVSDKLSTLEGQYLRPALDFQYDNFHHMEYVITNVINQPIELTFIAQSMALDNQVIKPTEGRYLFRYDLGKKAKGQRLTVTPIDCNVLLGCELFKYDPRNNIAFNQGEQWQWQGKASYIPYLQPSIQAAPEVTGQVDESEGTPVAGVEGVSSSDNAGESQNVPLKPLEPPQPVPIHACENQQLVTLFDGEQITTKAMDFGLLPLIGYDRQSAYHLGAIAERFKQPPVLSVDLTTQAVLTAELKHLKTWLEQEDRAFSKFYQDNKAQLSGVIMDVDSGEILAANALNNKLEKILALAEKDKQSIYSEFEKTPAKSPLRWDAAFHNGRYDEFPGSVFKLISAMALLERAESTIQGSKENIDIKRILFEGERATLTALGRQYNLFYKPSSNEYPYNADYKYNSVENWSKNQKNLPVIDLQTAVSQSINTWFAWNIDRITPLAGTANKHLYNIDTDSPKLRYKLYPLEKIIHLVGFDRPINLMAGQALTPRARRLPGYSRFQSWQMPPVFFDKLENRPTLRRMSIGYQTTLAPVHLATLSAMIATNRKVMPTLLKAPGQTAQDSCLNQPGTVAQKAVIESTVAQTDNKDENKIPVDLTVLRKGMKSAAQGIRGTASGPIKPYGARTWAKSGTSLIQKKGIKQGHNVWLSGWFCGLDHSVGETEPQAQPGQDCSKRYAFACNVSYVHNRVNGNGLGGSAVCGRWLKQLIAAGDKKEVW